MKRRLLAFLLAFVMTFSLVPVNTFAAESSSTEVTASAEAVKTEGAKTTVEPAALLADENGASADGDTWVKNIWRDYVLGGGAALAEPENYITLR